jgi:hypothetical protein
MDFRESWSRRRIPWNDDGTDAVYAKVQAEHAILDNNLAA